METGTTARPMVKNVFCYNCGAKMSDHDKYCPSCGKPILTASSKEPSDPVKSFTNDFKSNAGSESLSETVSHLFRFLHACRIPILIAAAALVLFVLVSSFWGHDLSGSYWTSDYFPVNQITFSKDGKFTAVSYNGGLTETYQGKYSKKLNGEYSLEFTSGKSSSGNAVTKFEVSSIGSQLALGAKKRDEYSLTVWVNPKISYWAWIGTEVVFNADGEF